MTSPTNLTFYWFIFPASTMFLLLTPSLLSTRMIAESIYLFTALSQTYYMIKNDTWARVMFSINFQHVLKICSTPEVCMRIRRHESKTWISWPSISMDPATSIPDIGLGDLITCYTYWMSHWTRKIMHVPPELMGATLIIIIFFPGVSPMDSTVILS